MAASNKKLENCEVCAANKAKYTCPKCEVRTCCLSCVNIHKKELECDGIRDKTKFIPAHEFSDLDLLNDYRLLEEINRSVDKLNRDQLKKYTRSKNLPPGLYKLKQAALMNNVKLEFMPHNFSRNKINTTFYNWKTKELFWRIEWIFQQAENTRWTTERVLDSRRLSELLDNILDPQDFKAIENHDIEDNQNKRYFQDKIIYYRSAGSSGIKILLKAEKVKNAELKFYELDLSLSIRENLANKTIIEFPTFYVILKDHSDAYNIIQTDEEEDEEISKNSNRYKRKQNNQPCSKKKKVKNPVNYFFNENTSEEEEETEDDKFTKINIPEYDK
ncbi:box C/D snoRNA protein 1, partial [Chelonus insularis]|uniref:box C/D snoRNA protein 1 n=1 Tax=Chelonus insularis TaxID=460826 RepID=UPI0015893B23